LMVNGLRPCVPAVAGPIGIRCADKRFEFKMKTI
jgi:hypothetical protein